MIKLRTSNYAINRPYAVVASRCWRRQPTLGSRGLRQNRCRTRLKKSTQRCFGILTIALPKAQCFPLM
ncbi:hypothetical protein RRG08_009051 [Elysia crispata]|uniref:Uncharacterized protein n=1 Tax=Elysia crispata TaxID=231223 RepID=A0AAE1ABE6_9GAST|nr:hypothetical protein RRG08_009051 [Elysia crispata]